MLALRYFWNARLDDAAAHRQGQGQGQGQGQRTRPGAHGQAGDGRRRHPHTCGARASERSRLVDWSSRASAIASYHDAYPAIYPGRDKLVMIIGNDHSRSFGSALPFSAAVPPARLIHAAAEELEKKKVSGMLVRGFADAATSDESRAPPQDRETLQPLAPLWRWIA